LKIAVIAGAVLLSFSTGIATARNDITPQFTIVGGVRMGATLDDATTVLGMPEVHRRLNDYECRAGWRTIGLTLLFLDLSNADPCGEGALVRATAASAKWQTGRVFA
jgi:hypothetical protein